MGVAVDGGDDNGPMTLPAELAAPSDWSRAADPSRRIGRAVEFHAAIGSTNDRAAELLRGGGEGIAVVADLQSAGRGRRGRTWMTEAGRNLAMSVGIVPRLAPAAAGLLGIAAALAVRDACAEAASGQLWVRWPNDVVTADGLKVAGLLVETALEEDRLIEAVVGIGVNVNWSRAEMPPEIAVRATSLAELAGQAVDRITLLARLLEALDREVAALEAGASPIPRLHERSALRDRRVVVELGAERIEGVVAGYAADGALLLDAPAGRVALASGEVVGVRDAAEGPA